MKIKREKLLKTLAVSLSVAALSSSFAFSDQFIKAGEFKVGMEISYPPFASYDGDKVVGFDPEMIELLTEQMAVQPVYSDNKFTSLILGLTADRFDAVINGMYITEERLEVADAIPYARTGASIMVAAGSVIKPDTERDLCGLKVGLQQGTSWVADLSELSDAYCLPQGKEPITIQEFPTAPEVSQALLSRNVEAQLELAGAAKLFADRTNGRIEITSSDLLYPKTLGIYLNKENSDLKSAIEVAFKTIIENGSFPALLERYELSAPAE